MEFLKSSNSTLSNPVKPENIRGRLYVTKRNGELQDVRYDKITQRLVNLCDIEPRLSKVDPSLVTQKVASCIFSGVKTTQLDELSAETCAYLSSEMYEYGILAGRISVSNLMKQTPSSFSEMIRLARSNVIEKTGEHHPLITEEFSTIVERNAEKLDSMIKMERDFNFDFFGFKVLEKSYLIKSNGKIIERPQYLFLRVALQIHGEDFQSLQETYEYLSTGYFIHATPTLFNSCTKNPQLSSCFLLNMKSDSLDGIYDTLKNTAVISKYAGGIGLSIHDVRAKGSVIRGTNGTSNGIIPMLKVFNNSSRYVDQGGGKRKGSIATYIEPWHADILDFLDLKKNTGEEELRTRDLFPALWTPDLFMQRVEENKNWTLFCPNECTGLSNVYGAEFRRLYHRYESEGKGRAVIRSQELWLSIVDSIIESGTPYMLAKDACNRKSNQKNLGTIKSSNLCTEIVQYTDENEIAVCNLASIALPKCIREGKFDHGILYRIAYIVTKNLDLLIDKNFYPVPEAKTSNTRHRPKGLGVQGLADVFCLLKLVWGTQEALDLDREIFETIYFAALTCSNDLSKKYGPYSSFNGSPTSEGKLQFDLWDDEARSSFEERKEEALSSGKQFNEQFISPVKLSGRWDWYRLKEDIKKFGLRSSLVVAPMPTASTAQILGNNECIEPYTSNIYARRVSAGEFVVINKHLFSYLEGNGLWNAKMKNDIIERDGSIQDIPSIPKHIKEIFRTVWEIPMRVLIDHAAERAPFIDQSQSFNCFMAEPTHKKISSMLFYAWKKGLKTMMYYLRTKPASAPTKVTVENKTIDEKIEACQIGCESCGA